MRKQKAVVAYAKALFQFAKAHEVVAEIGKQFDWLMEVWNNYPLLQRFFLSYAVFREEKEAKLESIFQKDMHPAFRSFFRFMVRRNHAGILPAVHKSFNQLQDDYFNRRRVKIISPFPLDDQYYQRFHTLLTGFFTQDVILTPVVDPEIIGGFIVNSDSFHIDCSIRHELEALRKYFCVLSNKGVKN
ncbi:MAG: ATP synthase F1 subunit delta [bacterium]